MSEIVYGSAHSRKRDTEMIVDTIRSLASVMRDEGITSITPDELDAQVAEYEARNGPVR